MSLLEHSIYEELMGISYSGNMNLIFSLWPIFVLIIVVLVCMGVFEIVTSKSKESTEATKPAFHYKQKQYFMTKHEADCYKALVREVGSEYFIFAQVHLSTIIDEKIEKQNWKAARAHVDRKSVDFVLCDKEFIEPKLAIELDDSSHERADRVTRDSEVERILSEANVPLLRIVDTQDLQRKILEKIQEASYVKSK